MIVISDTSVITNLAAIQQLQLLPELYGQVVREYLTFDAKGNVCIESFSSSPSITLPLAEGLETLAPLLPEVEGAGG